MAGKVWVLCYVGGLHAWLNREVTEFGPILCFQRRGNGVAGQQQIERSWVPYVQGTVLWDCEHTDWLYGPVREICMHNLLRDSRRESLFIAREENSAYRYDGRLHNSRHTYLLALAHAMLPVNDLFKV